MNMKGAEEKKIGVRLGEGFQEDASAEAPMMLMR